MKILTLVIFYTLFSINVFGQHVAIKSNEVKSFVIVDKSKFYVILTSEKIYQLYNEGQIDAIQHLMLTQSVIDSVKVKGKLSTIKELTE